MTFEREHQTSSDWQALQVGLQRFVRRRLPEDAVDDVVSDILEAIIRNRDSLKSALNPTAWIYATARSKVADFYRTRARVRDVLDDLTTDPTFHEPSEDAGRQECLTGLMANMDTHDQVILRAIDLESTRQTTFAQQNSLALPTVKSRIQRARKRLRDRLVACCPDSTPQNPCGNACQDNRPCASN